MKIRKALAALSVGALLAVGVATPAQAGYLDCAGYPGTVCFTEHGNFTGQVWRQFPWQITGCRNFGPENFDNEASTTFNNTPNSYSVRVYQYENCQGAELIIPSGQYFVLSGSLAWWNDRPSSVLVIAL